MPTTQRESKHIIARGILLACVLLAFCSAAFALNPTLDVSQYAHTSCKIRDGFASGHITAIAQTPDGYLWLGTEFGLLRFDGVKAHPFQLPGNQASFSGTIFRLLVARDGTLWIASDKGLSSWNGRQLTEYSELAGQFIFSVVEDRDGTIWAGSFSIPTGRLCAVRSVGVQCFGQDGEL